MEYRSLGSVRTAGIAGRPRLQQLRPPHRLRGVAAGGAQGARSRHHAVRHRRCLSQRNRRLRGVPRPRAGATAQGHRAGDQGRHADGARSPWRLAAHDHRRRGGKSAAARHRLDRPLPAAPARSADTDRRDAAGVRRSDQAGQGALYRLLELQGVAGGGGALDVAHRLGWRRSSPARTSTACWPAGPIAS